MTLLQQGTALDGGRHSFTSHKSRKFCAEQRGPKAKGFTRKSNRDNLHENLDHPKEQRDQDQRKHEQQVQYLQAELRTVNAILATKQQEAVHTLQDNARLLGDLSRAQGDLHQVQEEMRGPCGRSGMNWVLRSGAPRNWADAW